MADAVYLCLCLCFRVDAFARVVCHWKLHKNNVTTCFAYTLEYTHTLTLSHVRTFAQYNLKIRFLTDHEQAGSVTTDRSPHSTLNTT